MLQEMLAVPTSHSSVQERVYVSRFSISVTELPTVKMDTTKIHVYAQLVKFPVP